MFCQITKKIVVKQRKIISLDEIRILGIGLELA